MSLPSFHQPDPAHRNDNAAVPVLILEDERFDRHRLARMCSALDFPCEINTATTLGSFSAEIEGAPFGLILLDYELPDGTGIEAMEMVRTCARNLNAPTLMISGQNLPDLMNAAISAGCSGYLSKDALTKEAFSSAVREALRPKGGLPAATAKSFARDETAELLVQMTTRNARDVKPMVSRMMRQLRGLRTNASAADSVGLQAVEQNCLSLWAFLVEMERQDGKVLLKDLLEHTPASTPSAPPGKPRKPPSPFSKLKH